MSGRIHVQSGKLWLWRDDVFADGRWQAFGYQSIRRACAVETAVSRRGSCWSRQGVGVGVGVLAAVLHYARVEERGDGSVSWWSAARCGR